MTPPLRFNGHAVRALREARDWSVTQLAAAIRRSEASVRSIEAGRTVPSMQTYLSLLEALDVAPEELLECGAEA